MLPKPDKLISYRQGSIINFGSTSWWQGLGGMPVYTMAKATVHGLMRSFAVAVYTARAAAKMRRQRFAAVALSVSVETNLLQTDRPAIHSLEGNVAGGCLMRAIDALNTRYGRGTIAFCSLGERQRWTLRREFNSPQYTTTWEEVLSV